MNSRTSDIQAFKCDLICDQRIGHLWHFRFGEVIDIITISFTNSRWSRSFRSDHTTIQCHMTFLMVLDSVKVMLSMANSSHATDRNVVVEADEVSLRLLLLLY